MKFQNFLGGNTPEPPQQITNIKNIAHATACTGEEKDSV